MCYNKINNTHKAMTTQIKKKSNVQDIGCYFVYLANEKNKPLTNKKLQKLVYYAQAWSLVLNNQRIFDDPIEAWVHGPAIRSLYARYKKFGFGPISEEVKPSTLNISKKTKDILDNVWRVYGKFDSGYLEMLTHSERPWQEAREDLYDSERSSNEISLRTMKKYYLEKLEKARSQK
jgi:uncharacterized phage-associated protein